MAQNDQQYLKVIDALPRSGRQRVSELFQAIDFVFVFAMREWSARYRQTWLGFLWFLVSPLLTTAIFYFVFAKFARISTFGVAPFLYFWPSVLLWTLFSQVLLGVSQSLVRNVAIIEKVAFPRLVLPFAAMLVPLPIFAIQVLLFLGVSFFSSFPSQRFLLVPALVLFTLFLALGLGMAVAALSIRRRDLHHGVEHLLPLGMLVSPLFYTLREVPSEWQWAVALNPLTGLLEAQRALLFGLADPTLGLVSYSVIVSGASLVVGVWLFGWAEDAMADRL